MDSPARLLKQKANVSVHLSLVIPAFNEEDRIGQTLAEARVYLDAQPYDAEIIVVDDGSTDGTGDVVKQMAKTTGTTPIHYVHYEQNQGKGHAVRLAMLEHTKGRYRVYYDADASTPITELEKLWPHFASGADIVFGSRALSDSDIQVRQSRSREFMGRCYNLILRTLRLTRFRDTQCGFKGFRAEACAVVYPRQTMKRFSFDAELLFIAWKHGLRIKEIPIRWINSPQSRVRVIEDSAKMFLDLIQIRIRDWQGRYA